MYIPGAHPRRTVCSSVYFLKNSPYAFDRSRDGGREIGVRGKVGRAGHSFVRDERNVCICWGSQVPELSCFVHGGPQGFDPDRQPLVCTRRRLGRCGDTTKLNGRARWTGAWRGWK